MTTRREFMRDAALLGAAGALGPVSAALAAEPLMARREFAAQFPVATKRAVRAFLKSTEVCSAKPDEAARLPVKQGLTKRYDYALQEENGFIRSDPAKMAARSSDFRFLNELKKELKA